MSRKQKYQVSNTTTNNTDLAAETAVYLVDDKGKYIGVATLKSEPGTGLHYKFVNAIKLLIKE